MAQGGQAVHFINDNHVDLAGPHILQEALQCGPVGVAAGEAAVIVFGSQQRPPRVRLASDISLRRIKLGVEGVEVLLEPLVGRDARPLSPSAPRASLSGSVETGRRRPRRRLRREAQHHINGSS